MAKTSTYTNQKEELAEAPQVEELLKNLEFHKTIQNITRRISSALTVQEILVDIKEDIRKLFNFHILTIYLVDRTKNEIFTIQNDATEVRFPIDYSTFAGWVVQKKKMLHIADAYNDREIRNISDTLTFDNTLDKRTGVVTGQIVATPILRDGIILGVMEIMNKKDGNRIDEYNQIFLDEITGFMAGAFFIHLNISEVRKIYEARFNALIQKGAITSGQLDQAIMKSASSGRDITTILMERYQIPKSDIIGALSDFYSCPFTEYNDQLPVPSDLLFGIEKAVLVNMLWVPLRVVKGNIHVLINDPSDTLKRNKIENILESKTIQYELSLACDILKYIERFYEQTEKRASNPVQSVDPSAEETGATKWIKPESQSATDPVTQKASTFARRRTITLEPADEFSDDVQGFMEMKNQFDEMKRPSQITPLKREDNAPESLIRKEANATQKVASNDPIPRTPGAQYPDIENLAKIRRPRMPVTSPTPVIANHTEHQLLTTIIYDANSRQASDIHFEPDITAGNISVRMRINGQFIMTHALAHPDYENIIRQIKMLSHLETENTSIIQEGKFFLSRPSRNDISMSVTFIPTVTGMEDTVIHLSAKLNKIPLELLGLSENQYATAINILRQPRGLVFFVGQPHSGLTTTLHACLDYINSQNLKIWTAEDPIEIVQEGIRQVRIDPLQGFSLPKVLRSFLKADPDVIMASQINDTEAAAICMQAAIKGHLVLTSLWSENIPDTLERCMNMDIHHLVFADAMLAIMEQRLINGLCPKCKEKYHPSREEYNELAELYGKESFEELHIPYTNAFVLFRPKGCPSCGQTGYSGRLCASEIFIFTPQIKRMIRQKESPDAIYQAATASGMITLMQDGLMKVFSGFSDARHVRLTCLK